MKLSKTEVLNFQNFIWQYYRDYGRSFAWRETRNPYYIVVSEVMLQQTQTHRVVDKFEQFITTFATIEALAQAPLRDLLSVWQGLGYSRRAIALQKIAQLVVTDFGGELPNDPIVLDTFPGIGPATAASICAFAFNRPSAFIETNVRAVYIHSFFKDRTDVHDKELMPLVEQTVDQENAREWYYALMDYGVMLKKQCANPSRRSKHHTQQSKFEGSDRQIRGMILRALTADAELSFGDLKANIDREEARIQKALTQLCNEGFIINRDGQFAIV